MQNLHGDALEKTEADNESHRAHADKDNAYYNRIRKRQEHRPINGTLHVVLDFAEKVLLPPLECRPGYLHFTTVLKYYMFGISNSNLQKNFSLRDRSQILKDPIQVSVCSLRIYNKS